MMAFDTSKAAQGRATIPGALSGTCTGAVEKTKKQIQHMSNTIDDFRNFFKPSKEKDLFAVNTAVKEVLHLISDQFMKAHIMVTIDCTDDAVRQQCEGKNNEMYTCEPEITVYGYQNEFKQAVLNIFSNARDAIIKKREQGVFDADEKGEITILLSIADNTAILSIQDNGGGIPEEMVNTIFEPYFTTKGIQVPG